MILIFGLLYLSLFIIPFVSYGKAVSIFWVAVILYPHYLFDIFPSSINLYDLYLIFLFIYLTWKQKFLLNTNKIVNISFGVFILMLGSEFISLIFLQQEFVISVILRQLRLVIKLMEYGFLSIITANAIRLHLINERVLIQTYLVSITLLSIIGIFQIFDISLGNIFYNMENTIQLENFNRAIGSTKGPWIMGALTAMSSIIALNLTVEGPRKGRLVSLIIFCFSILGLILSRSRASWLMFAFSIPFFISYSKNRLRFIFIIFLAAILFLNIPFIYNTILFRVQYTLSFGSDTLDTSSIGRILQWKELFTKYEFKYLLTGYGKYSAESILGWDTLHNVILSTLTFNGIIGLFFFGYLYFSLLKTLRFVMKNEKDHYLKSAWKGIYIALISLLVYSMTADTFYSFLIMLSLFYLGTLAYERKIKILEIQKSEKFNER
jgi:hypothetical protein